MPSNSVPLGKDFLLVVHIDAEHQPDGHVEHDDRGAAGREKRQGEADDRRGLISFSSIAAGFLKYGRKAVSGLARRGEGSGENRRDCWPFNHE